MKWLLMMSLFKAACSISELLGIWETCVALVRVSPSCGQMEGFSATAANTTVGRACVDSLDALPECTDIVQRCMQLINVEEDRNEDLGLVTQNPILRQCVVLEMAMDMAVRQRQGEQKEAEEMEEEKDKKKEEDKKKEDMQQAEEDKKNKTSAWWD